MSWRIFYRHKGERTWQLAMEEKPMSKKQAEDKVKQWNEAASNFKYKCEREK